MINKIKAIDAARYLVSLDKDGSVFNFRKLNHLVGRPTEGSVRLNKMLHMAQNIHLAKYNSRLFDDEFFAFENGPVIEEVRKNFGWIVNNKNRFNTFSICFENRHYLDQIFEIFKYAPIDEFIDISHEDLAWVEAFKDKRTNNIMDSLKYRDRYKEQYAAIASYITEASGVVA